MKLCTGCKHLVHAKLDVCKAQDGPWVSVTNPYTGRTRLETGSPHGWFRPSVEQMRAVGAACGPEAVLYALPWWARQLRRAGLLLLALVVTGCDSTSRPAPSPKERADALALIAQLQQAGGMTRYSCEAREAYITPATWQQADADTKRGMALVFATACDALSMSIMDSQSGKRLARVGPLGYTVD